MLLHSNCWLGRLVSLSLLLLVEKGFCLALLLCSQSSAASDRTCSQDGSVAAAVLVMSAGIERIQLTLSHA